MKSFEKTTMRTNYCGDARISDCSGEMTVCGWVQRQRDLGQLIFIDLRDRTGVVQLAFDDHSDRTVFDVAASCRSEYVLQATGVVRERSSKNPEIPTGEVELEVTALKILGKSDTPPFEISDSCTANENLRLKYRYLDLRRPELQKNLIFRHKVAKLTRDYFDNNGFIELETPTLIKSTPEGARDFLVPSRLHKGHFYALPQSPQLYKQLTMVAGFDRYMQIARCYRDEDLRADRQPEFTQIDLEMSFVDMEDVLNIGEGYIRHLFKEAMGIDIGNVQRLTYGDAMNRFGSDKPDTRYAMEICDLTDIVRECGFGVFKGAVEGGGSVRAICAKNAVKDLSRKEIDKLVEFVKGIGGKGIAWARLSEDGVASSFAKFMTEDEIKAIFDKCGADTGDVVLIIADVKNFAVLSQLGQLRIAIAKKLDIIPKNKFNLLWIIEFPFFDWDEQEAQWVAMHHPFTAPMDECLEYLENDARKGEVRAKAYDLVLNGIELSSGSIRITDPVLQGKIFNLLGLSDEQAQEKFGYLTGAFKYGAPPHGGMALGLDRIVMQLTGSDSLRDVVAYPKLQNASEPMTACPATVDNAQLKDLGLAITEIEA